MEEIWRSGFEACSVKAISEKLGISRSSYYNAFGSRESLFREALHFYFLKSPDQTLCDEVADRSIKRQITSTFRKACTARASDPDARGCMAVNTLCELAGGPHAELGALLVEAVLANAARFEALLELAVTTGELDPATDVHGKALTLQSLLIGINTLSKAVRSETELWLAARTGLEALDLYEG
jgi:TetR/AcrR family transcriptional repressor of nem operon